MSTFCISAKYSPSGRGNKDTLDQDYYPVNTSRRIEVKTHRFSEKVTISRVRGYGDIPMPHTAVEYKNLYDFMRDWKEISDPGLGRWHGSK